MKIKSKLSLQFAIIVALILMFFSISVYFFSEEYREQELYQRLKEKALSTAKLLIEVKEIDSSLLRIIDQSSVKLVDEQIVIYNYLNEEVFNSLYVDDTFDARPGEPIELLNKIRLEGEVRFKRGKNEVLGILYNDQYNRFVIVASAFDKYGLSKLSNLRLTLIIAFFVALIITILAGLFYSEQALKPISNVIAQVDNISGSNLHLKVDVGNGKDEIAQLAITFNKMLERLDEAFKVQKSFVSNASHELRTPLTAITGQIEVTLMNKRTAEEYEKILASILEDITNLNKLSNGLLELAQTNSDINAINLKGVRVDELFWQARADILKRKPDYNIHIEFNDFPDEENKLIIKGNDSLLKTAIINLMENACKFSQDKQVLVNIGFDEKYIQLKFIDNGIGISKEDLVHIFEPFFRASNAKSINGHGIGLSLAKKIISLHSGDLHITSEINKGTTSFVQLPYREI
jgi:signal transduction histidine kinase